MNASVISIGRISRTSDENAAIVKKMWTWSLAVSGSLGILAGFGGLTLALIAEAGALSGPFSTIAVVMIAAAFPLWMFAAHCMDMVGNADK